MAVKPRRGDAEGLERALQIGRRIAAWRVEAGMTQADVARELGVDTRTYKAFEAGVSSKLTFGDRGQDNISRLEHGDLGWSGSGSTARWVGPGIDLLASLERIFGKPEAASISGIYVPEAGDSLADRIRSDPSISEAKRSALLAVLNTQL